MLGQEQNKGVLLSLWGLLALSTENKPLSPFSFWMVYMAGLSLRRPSTLYSTTDGAHALTPTIQASTIQAKGAAPPAQKEGTVTHKQV